MLFLKGTTPIMENEMKKMMERGIGGYLVVDMDKGSNVEQQSSACAVGCFLFLCTLASTSGPWVSARLSQTLSGLLGCC